MNGLILINKPRGPTSSTVSVWVREILGEKTGHCGTLDPNVSGVLPILVGKGIKLLEYLQIHDKEYVCIMKTESKVDEKRVKEVLDSFVGEIYQKPPLHSAVSKVVRKRKIYGIELLEVRGKRVLFRVECQHGTYIRKLVEDVGHVLGMKAVMEELRRTRVGDFTEQECVSLVQLKDACALRDKNPKLLEDMVKPLEYAVARWPKVYVKALAAENIVKGADLMAPGLEKVEGQFGRKDVLAIMSGDRLIAVGKALFDSKNIINQKRNPIVKLEKVLVS
jgi:H/ACA ribonucleoprotein complex subunit 4